MGILECSDIWYVSILLEILGGMVYTLGGAITFTMVSILFEILGVAWSNSVPRVRSFAVSTLLEILVAESAFDRLNRVYRGFNPS